MNQQLKFNIHFFRHLSLGAVLVLTLSYFFPLFYRLTHILAVLVPLIALVSMVVQNKKLILDKWTAEIYVFLGLWFVYSLIGLAWAKDLRLAEEYTRRVGVYILTFILFSQLFRKVQYRQHAHLIFQIIAYSYCLIYVWEIVTWEHLPVSRLYGVNVPIPTGVYFNENNSAVMLLLLSPFLTLKTPLTTGITGRIISLAVFLFILVAGAIQNSRIAVFFMALLGLYYFFRAKWMLKLISIVIISLGLVIFTVKFPNEYRFSKLLLQKQIVSTLNEGKSYMMTSSKIRSQVNHESIDIAAQSKLLGVGAGNYEVYMSQGRYHRTSWVLNAHNWWFELLANFGLLIFLGMLFIYLRWIYCIFILKQKSDRITYAEYDAYFISLLLFLPLSIVPSSIRGYYSLWIYFSLIHAVCVSSSTGKRKALQDLTEGSLANVD